MRSISLGQKGYGSTPGRASQEFTIDSPSRDLEHRLRHGSRDQLRTSFGLNDQPWGTWRAPSGDNPRSPRVASAAIHRVEAATSARQLVRRLVRHTRVQTADLGRNAPVRYAIALFLTASTTLTWLNWFGLL